ncbi:MAG TPA: hypothetical protein VM600_01395, partial [Actinomycetota bacterium]|nr:hypothetical protein [Actinomycetota bacterium]
MSIGVVVVHDDIDIVRGIGEWVESVPDLFVAGTSVSVARAGTVVVAGGDALPGLRVPDIPLVALASADVLQAARAALAAGAHEIVRWPDERERLTGAIRRAAAMSHDDLRAGGKVVCVASARGGSGASTLAALIA